jgi:hypothetical protein
VYDAAATDADNDTITFSLTGADAGAFNINAQTGVVTFKESPDFEEKPSYAFNVVANDGKGGTATQAVTVTVTDVEDDAVNLDVDSDNNLNTAQVFDAAGGDFDFTDNAATGSNSVILNFEEGDSISFTAPAGTVVNFTTGADDENDLEIIFNTNGVVSEIVLDDVLTGDEGLIFDQASAEAALGFDFFDLVVAAAPAPAGA